MIDITFSDFSHDDLYTKMQELNGKIVPLQKKWNAITNDYKAIKKYLSSMSIRQSSALPYGEDGNNWIEWDHEAKELLIEPTDDLRRACEAPLDVRIEAHPHLLEFLDQVIDDVEQNNAI